MSTLRERVIEAGGYLYSGDTKEAALAGARAALEQLRADLVRKRPALKHGARKRFTSAIPVIDAMLADLSAAVPSADEPSASPQEFPSAEEFEAYLSKLAKDAAHLRRAYATLTINMPAGHPGGCQCTACAGSRT